MCIFLLIVLEVHIVLFVHTITSRHMLAQEKFNFNYPLLNEQR